MHGKFTRSDQAESSGIPAFFFKEFFLEVLLDVDTTIVADLAIGTSCKNIDIFISAGACNCL